MTDAEKIEILTNALDAFSKAWVKSPDSLTLDVAMNAARRQARAALDATALPSTSVREIEND